MNKRYKQQQKLAATQIKDHVHQHNLINHHSCKTAVLQVSDDIRRATDQYRIGILSSSELHDLLIRMFGFTDSALEFMSSYLGSRKWIIFSNGRQSSEVWNQCGVAQGSIQGPLSFDHYCEDTDSNFNHACYYADDTQKENHLFQKFLFAYLTPLSVTRHYFLKF